MTMPNKKLRFLFAGFSVIMLLALILGMVGSGYAATLPDMSAAATRVIVVFRDGVTDQAVKDSAIDRMGGAKIRDLPLINGAVILIPAYSMLAFARDPAVLEAHPDQMASIADGTTDVISYSQQTAWGITATKANQVWDKNGDGQVDAAANAGTGVKIAVIDTGIDLAHPDLSNNIAGGYNVITAGTTSPQDDNGHGTHVAGIISASDNTLGVIGVAPQASLYAVKVLDRNGSGYYSDIVTGLQWAVTNHMQIVNMSLGGSVDDPALHAAIISASNAGIVVVAAAGNSGPTPDSVSYPGAYPEVIAVSAVDVTKAVASFSSRGPQVEIAAPGVAVLSTYWSAAAGSTYGTLSGTSMATPYVAGIAALVINSGIRDTNGNGLVGDEVRTKLDNTAADLGSTGRDNFYGFGLVDALAATSGTASPPPVVPPSVATNAANSLNGTSANLNGYLASLGSASSVNVSFLWGPTTAVATGETAPATVSSPGTFSAPLSGLTPGMTYYFRAKAVGNGTTLGAILTFTYAIAPPTVATNAATDLSKNSATLNATLIGLGSASTVNVSFLWGKTTAMENGETLPAAMTGTGPFSVTVSGLTPGTKYYFKAKAAGDSTTFGSVMSLSYTVSSPSVTTVAATAVTRTSATLNGKLGSLGSASSVGVSLLWGTTSAVTGGETPVTNLSASGVFSAGLTGLVPGTRYYFKAKATGDTTTYGTILSFVYTLRAPRVTTVAPTSITRTAATLNGKLTDPGTSSPVTVSFLWGTAPRLLVNETSPLVMTSTGAFATDITGLTAGRTYYFRATAKGDGTTLGAIYSFVYSTRPASIRSYSPAGSAISITANSVTLNGNLLYLGTAPSVTVSFLWGTTTALNGGQSVDSTLNAPGPFSTVITGLTPNTRYYYRAKVAGDYTSFSEMRTFVTAP